MVELCGEVLDVLGKLGCLWKLENGKGLTAGVLREK